MNLTRKKFVSALSAGIVATVVLSGCGAAKSDDSAAAGGSKMVKLTIATDNTTGALPILAGVQEGIFKKHGLDVTQQTVANITLIPAGLGKTYQIGESVGPITITSANSGLPVVAVAGESLVAGGALIASKDVKTAADLKGKTIGAPTVAGNINLATRAWLRKNGVNPDDVKFVQVPTPNMVDQLKGGLVDAVELQDPYLQQAKKEGFTDLGPSVADVIGPKTMTTWWLGDKKWAGENKTTVDNFKAALDETYTWITSNPDDARAIMQKFTKLPAELVQQIPINNFQTEIPSDTMEIWGKLMEQESGFKPKIQYSDLVLNP